MKLRDYIIRRIFLFIPVMFGLVTGTFFLAHVIPADAARAWAGPFAFQEQLEQIRITYGLNDPLHIQYLNYMSRLLHGDLGTSPVTMRPVAVDLITYFPRTIELTIAALTVALALGIPLGILTAVYRNSKGDHISRLFALAGLAMPIFWLGIILQLIFYHHLDLLPVIGIVDGVRPPVVTGLITLDSIIAGDIHSLIDGLKHLILPGFTLSYPSMAVITRLTRSSMLEVVGQDYIRTARAKGLTERVVMFRHALRNAIIPTLTASGYIFGALLGGAVLVESVFIWPGLGLYIVHTALRSLDYPAIMGVTLLAGFIYSIVNLLVDVSYAIIDPRIRLG